MKKIKYPRTQHLPWSPGAADDDLILLSTKHFQEKEVVVTEKLDGENTTLYRDTLHARSVEALINHPSRSWIKSLHATISYKIPERWRVCGENVYAKHSIFYRELKSFYYIFSIWNEKNICLSWDETCTWAESLDVPTPKVLYEGIWKEPLIKKIFIDSEICEGYVVRLKEAFAFQDFEQSIAKYVRKAHVQVDAEHWFHKEIVLNQLQK